MVNCLAGFDMIDGNDSVEKSSHGTMMLCHYRWGAMFEVHEISGSLR